MADIGSIAAKRQKATARLVVASNHLAKELGVEALSLPLTGRDMNFLHAQQLEAIAEYMETLANALNPAPVLKKVK